MKAFEKWLGRAKLFYHLYLNSFLQGDAILPSPNANYKNDLRKAFEAGRRYERRQEWIKVNNRWRRRKLT